MEVYEEELESYQTLRAECAAHNLAIEQEVEARIKEEAGFDQVPEQYRDKVWGHAWQKGHSSGYSYVNNILSDLVDIFV